MRGRSRLTDWEIVRDIQAVHPDWTVAEHIAYLDPAISQFLAGEPLIRTETASFGCAIRSVYYILPKAL